MAIQICLDSFQSKYPTGIAPINPEAHSESASNDDYESIGFVGFGNKNQSPEEKNAWATESKKLAERSLISRIFQLPLEFAYYFISNSGLDGTWWSKGFFSAKSLAETIANKFQNDIYGLKGDNVDAENYSQKVFGDSKTAWISNLNNKVQTKYRFLTPILGLINPDLANDIDQGLFEMIESTWWRKMSLNSGFYPGIVQDLLNKATNLFIGDKRLKDKEHPPTWEFITNQFKKHIKSANESKKEYDRLKESKEKDTVLLKWCKSWDQLTSVIMPFICLPSNILGDTVRPILRRLDLSGPLRTIIRTLSVSDRSLVGINYLFRFYLPEKIAEDEQRKNKVQSNSTFSGLKYSHLYIGSLIGDILDLPFTIFEDKINESNMLVQHSIEGLRILKNFAYDAFWSGRRIRIADETLRSITEDNKT